MNAKKLKGMSSDSYVFIVLSALEILMSYTFLGYIHIPPISLTLAYIPIMLAACLLTPLHSMAVGALFGIASMYKATAYYVLPADLVFSPFRSGEPVRSLLLSTGARMLFGLVIGFIFSAAKKSKHCKMWIGAAAAITSRLHALIVYIAMYVLFPEIVKNYMGAVQLGWKAVIAAVLCVCITELVWKLYNSRTARNFRVCIDRLCEIPDTNLREKQRLILGFAIFAVCMTLFATFYFSQRTSYMLGRHGLEISDEINVDLIYLQGQYMMAILALDIISVVVLDLNYKYAEYQKYLGEIDSVTSVMGRRRFLNCCENIQKSVSAKSERYGWFMFLDADNFKTINDTYGHAAGDRVLCGIAAALKRNFGDYGIIGRIGGDEFAVMINRQMTKTSVCERLDGFLKEIGDVLPEAGKVTCSIGVSGFKYPAEVPLLMNETDSALYEAKNRGRACYVIKETV